MQWNSLITFFLFIPNNFFRIFPVTIFRLFFKTHIKNIGIRIYYWVFFSFLPSNGLTRFSAHRPHNLSYNLTTHILYNSNFLMNQTIFIYSTFILVTDYCIFKSIFKLKIWPGFYKIYKKLISKILVNRKYHGPLFLNSEYFTPVLKKPVFTVCAL